MTYDDFFNQYNGQKVEKEDSGALYQCMDLAFAWCDALGIDRAAIRHPYAYQIWDQASDVAVDKFWFIPNSPNGIPQKGDIVVWRKDLNGGAGHVGICNGRASLSSLDVFEQNDPLGSVSHVKTYGYTWIYGWLRVKQIVDTSALQAQIAALQTKITNAKNALA